MTETDPDPAHRRRTRRAAHREAGPADPATRAAEDAAPPVTPSRASTAPADSPPVPDDRGADRALRHLAGFRPTQLPPGDAMRAREAARPTPQDIADAADALVLVRRHYVPPPATTGEAGAARRPAARPIGERRQVGETNADGSAS